MGWMSRLRKPNPNRKQLLFFAQDELKKNYYAVVRITWFSSGQVCAVTEAVVYENDLDGIEELPSIVREALHAQADVSVLCIAKAADIGLAAS